MLPLLAQRTEADGDPYEIVERAGLRTRAEELDERASALGNLGSGKSAIYEAWIRYTRQHPEQVFGTWRRTVSTLPMSRKREYAHGRTAAAPIRAKERL
jgi:hypothetical protein